MTETKEPQQKDNHPPQNQQKEPENHLSLYQQLKAAGVELDSHQSDLYCKITATSLRILMQYKNPSGDTTLQAELPLCRYKRTMYGGIRGVEFPSVCCVPFKSKLDDAMWVDLVGQYDPFWEKKIVVSKS